MVSTVTFKECCEVGVYINPYFTDEETEAERLRFLTQITAGVKGCLTQVLRITLQSRQLENCSPGKKPAHDKYGSLHLRVCAD